MYAFPNILHAPAFICAICLIIGTILSILFTSSNHREISFVIITGVIDAFTRVHFHFTRKGFSERFCQLES